MTSPMTAGTSADSVTQSADEPLLRVRDLRISVGDIPLVRGVSLDVRAGEIVSVVGESGSGKSLTSLAVLGLLPPELATNGTVEFRGENVTTMNSRRLRQFRASAARMIFQDPGSAMNPVLTIGFQVIESIRAAQRCSRAEAREQALAMIRRVGIAEPQRCLSAYPRELSGGMLQRVVIAMALAVDPPLLICDEPTTALDVTTQAQVLDLIRALTSDMGTGVILTTHDMAIAADYSDRIVVMYAGQVVEHGPTRATLATPQHPYLWSLLNAHPDSGEREPFTPLTILDGAPPRPDVEIPGCRFAPRCPFRQERCSVETPVLRPLATAPERSAACLVSASQEAAS
ncbi:MULTISPECIES: ABC transporter ATP-binding protein [Micromonospora]|uniref:ABC transporter ATP-binding protein n=1 Tax=Micromonospora profundi TaxID=1420889 RepID=A0AAJ6HSB1_9ACTN|nr:MULTISPECIES: ABC transporter ATP-binding protein [Micromonospora]NJC11793.1 oligopeptide/dipeptide ABC transporter ATP-binding protein [Micromonospora profundi]WLS43688.1 ABC transporter ATP-binding protein [Micromonospora profundi]